MTTEGSWIFSPWSWVRPSHPIGLLRSVLVILLEQIRKAHVLLPRPGSRMYLLPILTLPWPNPAFYPPPAKKSRFHTPTTQPLYCLAHAYLCQLAQGANPALAGQCMSGRCMSCWLMSSCKWFLACLWHWKPVQRWLCWLKSNLGLCYYFFYFSVESLEYWM